ncbi:bifunctional glycosyltransferase family 2/GtrA family protein [Streptomyces sp. B3I8]|jgi:putative flippase GtrA|uniref:bifunctional glycosyltransferase family 2/GtrA family protein n=1 Tax=Streptomyces sp. B3I8 TaxID=3042303 RepID=UPI002781DA75|nr:bifunctional glycosyltransferase family 2/GtrA family protein [Streptomyces sp. B3I8]MDQ0790759.1 putative flippase GtrA [Streptomyces sp. B3I8]
MTTTAKEPAKATQAPLTEIVIPVRNEAKMLPSSIHRLHDYLVQNFPYPFLITIAESGSVDSTRDVGAALARRFPEVEFVSLDGRGRGLALRHVWAESRADVVSYMDADLSIDLNGFLPLVAPLASGHSDLAIGTRHARGASVRRSLLRSVLSRTYNLILRIVLGVNFSDAQCGFKAGRREVVQALLPTVHDDKWFFDTELLCVAQRQGMRIHEVPVDCLDDPETSVDIRRTVWDMLRGVVRVAGRRMRGSLIRPLPPHLQRPKLLAGPVHRFLRFAAVGAVTGVLHVLLYLGFRTMMPALPANGLGLLLATVLNTAANRRITFGVQTRHDMFRHQAKGAVAFLISLLCVSASLLALGPHASRAVELCVLLAGDALASLLRFTLMQQWVFARPAGEGNGGPVR